MSKILKVDLVDTDYNEQSHDAMHKPLYLMFGPRLYTEDCPNLVKRVHGNAEHVKVSEEAAVAALETLAVYFVDKQLCSGSLDIYQRESDLASQKEIQELSLKEIEDILGYPIKIVNK